MRDGYYTTEARYEVGIERWASVSGFCRTQKSAFKNAILLYEKAIAEKIENPVAYVFDRMAHKGKAELWHVVNGDLIVKSVRNG